MSPRDRPPHHRTMDTNRRMTLRDDITNVLVSMTSHYGSTTETTVDAVLAVIEAHTETEYKIELQVYHDRDVWRGWNGHVYESRDSADKALAEADNGQGQVRLMSRRVGSWEQPT